MRTFALFFASFGLLTAAQNGVGNLASDLSPTTESKRSIEKAPVAALTKDTPPGYVLGPGDQISIHIFNFEEISDKPIPIDTDGHIHLPLVGDLEAAGNTIQQLQTEIADHLRTYVLRPDVTVSVVEFRSQPVSILGAVRTPGIQQVQGHKTVLEMLSLAGGVDPSAGPILRITRELKWGPIPLASAANDPTNQFSIAEINLKSLLDSARPEENILIRPNDVISVPRGDTVYVIGEVQKAGGYVLNQSEQVTVLQALSMAGGMSQMARPRDARILRRIPGHVDRTEIPVDLANILDGRTSDIPMRAEDVLFVPNSIPKRAALRAIEAGIEVGSGIAIWRRP